ncbi:MAG: hypothetical protein IPP63_12780 [Chloracidobacterium sp.]|nr:hypothetical protein [Chloracidobacterium sp.]
MERISVTTIRRRGGDTGIYCDICRSQIEQGTLQPGSNQVAIDAEARILTNDEVADPQILRLKAPENF